MILTVAPAQPTDAPMIAGLISDWVVRTAWMPKVHTQDELCQQAHYMIERDWVTVIRGPETGGFIARDGEEIHALYVGQEARRCGIGHALMQQAKDQTRTLRLWVHEQNLPAQLFYESEGFRAVGWADGRQNDEGLPEIRYQWKRCITHD